MPTQATPSGSPQAGGDAGVGDLNPRHMGVRETRACPVLRALVM